MLSASPEERPSSDLVIAASLISSVLGVSGGEFGITSTSVSCAVTSGLFVYLARNCLTWHFLVRPVLRLTMYVTGPSTRVTVPDIHACRRLANRPGIPGIVPEIVLLSRRPGNLPNVPGSLANWLRFQAPVSVYDIHTRNATVLGERRQPHAVLRNLQNFQLT